MRKEYGQIGVPMEMTNNVQPPAIDQDIMQQRKEAFMSDSNHLTLLKALIRAKSVQVASKSIRNPERPISPTETMLGTLGVRTITGAAFIAEDLGLISADEFDEPFDASIFRDIAPGALEVFNCYLEHNGDVTRPEIAKEMRLSESTVSGRVQESYRILDTNNLTLPLLAYRKLVRSEDASGVETLREKKPVRKIDSIINKPRGRYSRVNAPISSSASNDTREDDTSKKDLSIDDLRKIEARKNRAKKRVGTIHTIIHGLAQQDPIVTPALDDHAFISRAAQAGVIPHFERTEYRDTRAVELSYIVGLAHFKGLETNFPKIYHGKEMAEAMPQILGLMTQLIAQRNEAKAKEKLASQSDK